MDNLRFTKINICDKKNYLQISLMRATPYYKRNFTLTTKIIKVYSPTLRRKVNRLIMINILKQIVIILKTQRKEIISLTSLKTVDSSVPKQYIY